VDPVAEQPVAAQPVLVEPEAPETEIKEREDEHERQPFRLPSIPARVAAVVTGVVVGLVGAVLTYGALQGCDTIRGTQTCGGGPGLALLVVILVLMVLLGGVLLAAWQVSESPRGTSFLAVGALAVVLMLTSADQASVWTFVTVPVLAALTYLLATWVTTTYVEPQPERGPGHDVR
jgi:pheromone shutdown protein TraB